MASRSGPVIAIDGPAGSGKSTLARGLAEALSLPYVNTGLMYRALTRRALTDAVRLDNGPILAQLAGRISFELDTDGSGGALLQLSVDGDRPGDELSAESVEAAVSEVSRHPQVRAVMAAEQRRLGDGGAVVEGRDIGSVIFPDAEVKIFLVATAGERASRRVNERGGDEALAAEMAERDSKDARVNPFVPAKDAVELDNTGRTPADVLEEALALVRERIGAAPQ